ncbi:MAG: hemerythrin domain-containing protein [Myxococcota bacterium]
MKITECLNVEHGVFLTQLDVLEKMLRDNADADEIRACALLLAAAVEKHRALEEELLYPAILRAFGQGFPPMRVMEAEHKEIERCIHDLDARRGDAATDARELAAVLREHIGKEVDVLFPMAERGVPSADLEQMACRCAERHGR